MTEETSAVRVLVVGGGGIGGTVAGHLTHAGVETWTLVTNPKILSALREQGFRHRGHTALTQVASERFVGNLGELTGAFDFVLLAVPPPQVEQVVRELGGLLSPDGYVVCFQNGLCEQRVARILPERQVIGGIVTWGASMPEPGVYDKTSEGGFTLGRLDGSFDAKLHQLAGLLGAVGPVELTANLLGARWAKLAINSAISTLGTLGGCKLGELLKHGAARRVALDIVTEAIAVTAAQGIRLEKLSGVWDLNWVGLGTAGEGSPLRLAGKHLVIAGVAFKYRKLRSSMLSALERGREPSVDFLNGEVVSYGRQFGVATPVNARAQALVWEIARGERSSGLGTIDALYRETR